MPPAGSTLRFPQFIVAGAVFVFVGAATSFDGATTHLPALLLRAFVVAVVITVWPAALRLGRAESLIPLLALATVLLGMSRSPQPGVAAQAVVNVLLVILCFVALRTTERRWQEPAAALWLFLAAGHSLWAVAERLGGASRGSGGFFNPNDLAAFVAPAWVLVAAGPARLPARWRWGLWVLLTAGLLCTASRSGVLAAGLAAAVLLLARLRHRRSLFVGAGAACVLTAVLVVLPRWQTTGDRYAFSRLDIWQRSVEVALAAPLGVGLAGYPDALRRAGVPLDGPVRYPRLANHAHSEPLHNWVELGWLGLVATLLPVGLLVVALERQRRAGLPVATHWAMLIAFAVPAAVSASLHVPPVAFAAAAWAAAVLQREQTSDIHWTPRWPRLLPTLVGCGALLVVTPSALSATAMQQAASRRDRGERAAARGWAQWATRLAPWSAGAVMLEQSLRYADGAPGTEVGDVLLGLAENRPTDPEPLRRVVWLLQQEARRRPVPPEGWRDIASLQRELVERDPLNALERVNLADLLLNAGDRTEADAALVEALRLEPLCAAAHAHQALLAVEDGAPERASAALQRVSEASRHAGAYDGYGREVLSVPENLRNMLLQRGLSLP